MISQFRIPKILLKKHYSRESNDLTLDDILSVDLIRESQKPAVSNFLKTAPLGEALKEDSDFHILETIKYISLKRSWDINEATVALRDACIAEWARRYGPEAEIPDVEISKEALEQLKFENEYY